jgi:hypothetical protein
VVFPNPVPGGQVQILPQTFTGLSAVKVKVYTLSYKLVLKKDFPPMASGYPVTLELLDDWGEPLAAGFYHVVVIVGNKKSMTQLLVTR